jgi:uncharacterized protein YecE (DUF72 family)
MRSAADCATGYPLPELERWAQGAREWARMGETNEAFVFFINGAKERAPAAAMEMIKQLSAGSS